MIKLLYLDVIEICLVNIPKGKTTGKIKPAIILEQLSIRAMRKCTIDEIYKLIKEVFPVYKNKRQNTKCFKISQSRANDFISSKRLLSRPIEHARWSYFYKEVK
ncbi:MAG: hypothetical protein KAQ89_04270 [Planctomycetes bacterium]|nr:hypothetical protein [Planctomycetota bacterium]